ncbi:hypothetical protein ACFP73_14820, partial [Tatumella punctata]
HCSVGCVQEEVIILAGYVILIISGNQATPLTEHIYPTETQCQTIIDRLHSRLPAAELLCGEVERKV